MWIFRAGIDCLILSHFLLEYFNARMWLETIRVANEARVCKDVGEWSVKVDIRFSLSDTSKTTQLGLKLSRGGGVVIKL